MNSILETDGISASSNTNEIITAEADAFVLQHILFSQHLWGFSRFFFFFFFLLIRK